MKLTKPIIILLAISAGVAGLVSCRTQPTCKAIPRPLYGTASLSKEEKRILSMFAEDCKNKGFIHVAYSVGMICLKHHLTSSEIDRLFPEWNHYKKLHVCQCQAIRLFFDFDAQGNIVNIYYVEGFRSHNLPPVESVTIDAPIDLPPLPLEHILYTDAVFAILTSRGWRAGRGYESTPPDFASLSYLDAKTVVDVMIFDVNDIIPHLRIGAEYPRKIVDQFKSKPLTDDNKALAMYLLGSIKTQDTNSIGALIDRIDFKVNVPHSDPKWRDLHPWSLYPARDALLRIGEISVGPIVQDLPGETNGLRRQLLCAVVSTFGRTNWTTAWQPKAAIEQLQQMRATEVDAVRHQNIDAALGLLINNKVDLNIGWSGYLGE